MGGRLSIHAIGVALLGGAATLCAGAQDIYLA
ncbi:MAG: hypothetical protein RIR91_1030, partial [Verrucomicrobiota bacterium]